MKAKYAGACKACGKYHIVRGDQIVRFNRGWAKPGCVERKKQRDQEVTVLSSVLVRMRSQYSLVLGYVVPEGCTRTPTRRHFIRRCKELEAISEEEERILLRHWHGILDRDLAD